MKCSTNITNNNNNGKPITSRNYIEVSNGYGYIYNPTATDSQSIGEMVFGSVAMSFKGTSFKASDAISYRNKFHF